MLGRFRSSKQQQQMCVLRLGTATIYCYDLHLRVLQSVFSLVRLRIISVTITIILTMTVMTINFSVTITFSLSMCEYMLRLLLLLVLPFPSLLCCQAHLPVAQN